MAAAMGRKMAGTTTSLPKRPVTICLKYPMVLENLMEPPRMISASGVATRERSVSVP